MTERHKAAPEAIEKAARAALDDLRLVINSLDIDDGDLRMALAGLHERLFPQLRRLGVELDCSMEDLPDVSGITPVNALSILRILQEAVTNAPKHGPARRIEVRGAAVDGRVVVTVWNDENGAVEANGKGAGLNNMKARARKLGGEVCLTRATDHSILTLSLPLRLTDA